ncbi:MAG TPA: SDR family NAD(P)-dependent oxidoreductase [Candidatus Polarisedimenticolaceae bacterium]|nr:SDR family NAD(P)-dependent oxidoreductase [Candidatus Polarisedimenticolaceae bacterium]
MKLDFEGRDVVVTGATGELGEAVARRLLEAGATLHLPARDAAKAPSGKRVHVTGGIDLTDEASVSRYYASLPPLWASIHSAGGFSAGAIDATGLADLRRMLDMNGVTAFLCSREAVKNMRGRGGRIVNVSAQAGIEPRRGHGMIAYTTSKAAVAALTLALAEEVASEGIWVNAVVPSIMDTDANRKAMPKADFSKWPNLDDVAATVAFLASPQNGVTRAALVPVYGKS